MRARRFAPLFWCQFLSAFNDNFVRQMLALLILFQFGGGDEGAKIQLAVALFVLPSIPLSAIGGEIADANDKAAIARKLKLAEIFVQAIAALGVLTASLALLYLALFGLGVIAALFGPIKYGILPDHLRKDELIAGNALVEGATFAAIILGLVFGGYAAAMGREPWSVALQLTVVALACYATARWIPATQVGAPGLRVNWNPYTATRDILKELRANDKQWVGCLAVSWFWTVGALTLSLAPVIIKARIGGGIEVETAVNLFFAVGVAAGSLMAAKLSHGRIWLDWAPYMLVAMGLIAIDLGVATHALPRAQAEIGLVDFFTSPIGLRVAIEILVYSCAAGLFVVPIFAAVQAWSSVDRRARVIGANNTLNSLFMVAGTLAVSILLKTTGLDESTALAGLGGLNLLAAAWVWRRLPRVEFRGVAY
jgi:acyl-[acyl-carrier-protein]-phospholipid O-acyltransferase/long-chain-fatty-acid--[acyl-carrier-protein] ligase